MKRIKILLKNLNIIDKLFVILSSMLFILGFYELFFNERVINENVISTDINNISNIDNKDNADDFKDIIDKEKNEVLQSNDNSFKVDEKKEETINDEIKIDNSTELIEKDVESEKSKVDYKEDKNNLENNDNNKKENLSNKQFKNISKSKPDLVKGDYSGRWRIIKIKTKEDILDYCFDYYMNNFEDDTQIHCIINTQNNTITTIEKLAYTKYLTITVREYSKKEEKKCNTLNTGNILQTYWINLDNKIIEEFDSNDLENKAVDLLDDNDIRHKDIIKYRLNNILKNQFKDNITGEATLDGIRVNINGSINSLSYDDCIVLVDLTWKQTNSINMTRKMVELYSNQFAIEIAKELENQSEIVFFWKAEYTDMSLKHTYSVVNKKAYHVKDSCVGDIL